MKMRVFVEQVDGSTFRATASSPVALACEGKSRDEAIDGLAKLATQKLSTGELVEVEVPGASGDHPWQALAGIWKDHPDFEDYAKSVAEYRHSADRQGAHE